MCDFIEHNPQLSRAIIDSCFMIEEAQVQAMVIRACRHMSSQGAGVRSAVRRCSVQPVYLQRYPGLLLSSASLLAHMLWCGFHC
jgi:hypothetical protein